MYQEWELCALLVIRYAMLRREEKRSRRQRRGICETRYCNAADYLHTKPQIAEAGTTLITIGGPTCSRFVKTIGPMTDLGDCHLTITMTIVCQNNDQVVADQMPISRIFNHVEAFVNGKCAVVT